MQVVNNICDDVACEKHWFRPFFSTEAWWLWARRESVWLYNRWTTSGSWSDRLAGRRGSLRSARFSRGSSSVVIDTFRCERYRSCEKLDDLRDSIPTTFGNCFRIWVSVTRIDGASTSTLGCVSEKIIHFLSNYGLLTVCKILRLSFKKPLSNLGKFLWNFSRDKFLFEILQLFSKIFH